MVIGIADGAFSADDKTTRIAGTSWGSWVHGGYAAGTRFTRGSVSTTARRARRWLTRPVWGSVHGFGRSTPVWVASAITAGLWDVGKPAGNTHPAITPIITQTL